MSTSTGDATATQTSTNNNSTFTLLSILSKDKLASPNYIDWMRNLKMGIWCESKEYVVHKPLLKINELIATPEELATYKKPYDDTTKVACIMLTNMVPEL